MNLDEIRKLIEAATPGAWFVGDWSGRCHEQHAHGRGRCKYQYTKNKDSDHAHHYISAGDETNPTNVVVTTDEYGALDKDDARFIAAARTLLPALLEVAQWAEDARDIYLSGEFPAWQLAHLEEALAALEAIKLP